MGTPHPASAARREHAAQAQTAAAGFSQVDLLTVLGVLVLLALLLTPALARTRMVDQGFQCRNNLGRLVNAWRMYVEDNSDKIPAAFGIWPPPAPAPSWITTSPMSWTGNATVDGQNAYNWDPGVTIKQSPLWPYCGNTQDIWRCPSDAIYSCIPTNGPFQGQSVPRVRSYSMSCWFNDSFGQEFSAGSFTVYKKLADCLRPGPAMTFVFLHERPDCINDGEFVVSMSGYPGQPSLWRLVDFPTSQHDGACGFSFVDGHSEMKRWLDRRTMPPIGQGLALNVSVPNSPDAYWLMDHSTRKP